MFLTTHTLSLSRRRLCVEHTHNFLSAAEAAQKAATTFSFSTASYSKTINSEPQGQGSLD